MKNSNHKNKFILRAFAIVIAISMIVPIVVSAVNSL